MRNLRKAKLGSWPIGEIGLKWASFSMRCFMLCTMKVYKYIQKIHDQLARSGGLLHTQPM